MMNQTPFLLTSRFMVMAAMIIGTTQTASVVTPTMMPAAVAGLAIKTSSKEVTPSVTSHLSVNCTFSKSDNQQGASIISLILSRWNKPSESMQEILTVTSLDPHTVTELQQVGGSVDGGMDQNGDAFLSLAWDYPSESVATKYICQFHAIDAVGHPLEAQVGLEVTASDIDFSKVAEELRFLAEWRAGQIRLNSIVNMSQEFQNNVLSELESINAAQNLTISKLRNTVDRQKMVNAAQNHTIDVLSNSHEQKEKVNAAQNHTIDVLTNTLDRQEKTITAQDSIQKMLNFQLQRLNVWVLGYSNFKDVTMTTSSKIIDQQQLFWTKTGMNCTQAQKLCWRKGGKLAEFAFEELEAVKSQLKAEGMSDWSFWVGLRRDDPNSPWVWASDGRDAGSITWDSTPSSTKHCAIVDFDYRGYLPYSCSESNGYVLCAKPV